MLNSRQLEAFSATVRTGSMTAAARALSTSQPSISRYISDLEARIGFTLFERKNNKLEVTHEGECFFAEVEQHYVSQETLLLRAEEIRRFEDGEVRIATIPAGANWLVPQAIKRTNDLAGLIKSSVQMRSNDRVAEFLTQGRVEIGVLNALGPNVPTRNKVTFSLPCCVVLPPEHALAQKEIVTAADLQGECLNSLGAEYLASACKDQSVLSALERATVYKTNLSILACSQVVAGLGIALSDPLTARIANSQGMSLRRFEPPIPYPIVLAHSGVGRATRAAQLIFDQIEALLSEQALNS